MDASAIDVQVSRATSHDAQAWDDYVFSHPHGTAFHAWGWANVFGEVYNQSAHHLLARHGGTVVGVLPIIECRTLLSGRLRTSMPFLNYGGPLANALAIEQALCEVALREGASAKLIELRTGRSLELAGMDEVQPKVTVILDIAPKDPDAVFKGFASKLRSQVRRAQREGIEVRVGHDQLDAFMTVLEGNMRDLGSPAHGKRFYRAVLSHLGARCVVACAYLNSTPVAAGWAFVYGGEMEITWASSLRKFNRFSPNMALYWAMIEHASKLGLERFNFGRCSPDSPTHKFKLQWGGRTVPLPWHQRKRGATAAAPSKESPAMAMASRLWQHLPVALTRVVGPVLIREFP
jgi:FemAB-related protein (PEP-CTERM system-associated)